MKTLFKALIVGAVLVGAGFGAFVLVVSAPEPAKLEPSEVATAVRVTTVARKLVQMEVRSQGNVEPRVQSDLVPEVSGRVQWMSPNLVAGGAFDKNEILLKLDDRDYRSTVERNQASVERRRAEDEHARFELGRLEELVKKSLTSQSNLEAALRTQRIAAATLRDAEIALTQAQRDLWRTEIRAPYGGLIRTEKVDVGQFISRGQAIASIYASDAVEVRLPVADAQLAFLDLPLGTYGELAADVAPDVVLTTRYGGREYQWNGKVVRTEAEIDSRSRMVNVVARITHQTGQPLPPIGLFVNAAISGRNVDGVVALPRSAIRNQDEVLIVDGNSRMRFRKVELFRFDGDQVFVSGGLNDGDMVNLSPIQTVVDGMKVAVTRDGPQDLDPGLAPPARMTAETSAAPTPRS